MQVGISRYDEILYLIGIRGTPFPDEVSDAQMGGGSASEGGEDVLRLAVFLELYFDDLLSGDFRRIQDERYWDYVGLIKKYTPLVINLPRADPWNVKFWRGDYSGVKELRNRGLT